MKKTKAILIIVLTFSFFQLSAQNVKYGYIDSSVLLEKMPERAQAEKDLQEFSNQLESQVIQMSNEFEIKLAEYQEKSEKWIPETRSDKEQELQQLQQKIEVFATEAQQKIVEKESVLIEPILKKAKDVIEEVGKEKGYLFVYDTSTGCILYVSEECENILPFVLAKMGIQ
jgi:outer membrane protein